MTLQRPAVYTIGHSTHALEHFVELLQGHGVTEVADVRSSPYSRFTPQFNREGLERKLHACGIRYVFLGRELGGRSDDPSCYENGQVQYSRLASTDLFRQGLERVKSDAGEYCIALMCAEKDPLECHRTLLVAPALEEQGFEVMHILSDGELWSNAHAMEKLLEVWRLQQPDMFRSRAELIADALKLQAKKVAYVDRKLAAGAREPG
jgi:uncharacterized protein (DUF488 family)